VRISLPDFDVPQLDELVVAGGGDGLAVGRELHRVDAIGMAGNGAQWRALGDVPDFHFAAARGQAASRR
jgi:hypothetical protein